jgi:beta-1,4-mannosyl-glycoprotein beta-1,4-N-acetylglucosaminyltransferase
MIYDCFTFYNELDILEIRLSLLYPHVDFFVITEAGRTFRSNAKEFIFERHRDRFGDYLDKIIYIRVNDMPADNDPWVNEGFQRNCITRGLQSCRDDDRIIISDIDEIWDPRILHECTAFPSRIEMPFYYYNLNYRVNIKWTSAVITTYAQLKQTTPDGLRRSAAELPVFSCRPDDRCFHLSFLYARNIEQYAKKIANFSHAEYDRDIFRHEGHIRYCLKYGIDIFLRPGIKLKYRRNRYLMKIPAFARFTGFYHKRTFFSLWPSPADLRAAFHAYLYRKHPEIRYNNPVGNSIKYIIRKRFKKKHA